MNQRSERRSDQLHFGTEVSSDVPNVFKNPNAGKEFFLSEELLHTHMAIFGGTRMGKSKLFEQICRELIRKHRGFCFLDPHSDTAEDVIAFLTREREKLGIFENNIHYLNPYEKLFSFDPFHYEPNPDDPNSYTRQGYLEWLDAKVKDVERIITRVLGETEADSLKQVRMHRWMRDVLYAIGIQDADGQHLGMHEALILLQPDDPRYPDVFNRVAPLLAHKPILGLADDGNGVGPDVLTDLETMARVRDPARREAWVESSINRLRILLSPIIRLIFEPRGERIEFRKIIASNGIIVAPLGKRERFHQSDGQMIAGLIIRELADAVVTAQRDRRNQYYLYIDEAQNFIGEDLKHLFKESGKYKLSIGLAVQSLDNLQQGDIDLCETVLGMCGIRISFKQQHRKVAQLLAGDFGYPLRDYTPLEHEVFQPDGVDLVALPSVSAGTQKTKSSSLSLGTTKSISAGKTVGQGLAEANTTGTSHGLAIAHSVAQSLAKQHSIAKGESYSDTATAGSSHGVTNTDGVGNSLQVTDGTGQALSDARSHSKTAGEAKTSGSAAADQTGHASNRSTSEPPRLTGQGSSRGPTHQTGEGDSHSHTLTYNDSSTASESKTAGHTLTDQRSINHGTSNTDSANHSLAKTHTDNRSLARTKGGSLVETNGVNQAQSLTDSETETLTKQQSQTLTASLNVSDSISETAGLSQAITEGESEGETLTISYGVTPIARHRKVMQATGKLKEDLDVQDDKVVTLMQSLLKQQCMVCVGQTNYSTVIKVAGVYDQFAHLDPEWKAGALAAFKKYIYDLHPYYFDRDPTLLVDYYQHLRLNAPEPDEENPLTQ